MAKWMAFALALAACAPAQALTGPARNDETLAPHLVMLLKRDGRGSSFCTASVIARDVLLTAAHCVSKPADMRIYWPGLSSQSDLQPVRDVAVHPGYRPDAIRTRERSIEIALVRAAAPLPSRYAPLAMAQSDAVALGQRVVIAGFGLAREGDERSGGALRSATLAARAPLSSILLWAEDPQKRGIGACTGDSGGPILSEDMTRIVAVTVWSRGEGKRLCGALTQGVLVAPQRAFIDDVLRRWSAP